MFGTRYPDNCRDAPAGEMSDFMLKNENFKKLMINQFGDVVKTYMKVSSLYDRTMIFINFSNKEYASVVIELIDQWNGMTQEGKAMLIKDYPEIYNELNVLISKIQTEIAQ